MLRIQEGVILPLQSFLKSLPLLAPPELLFWAGWPYIVGLAGLIVLITGTGMLARLELARLLAAGSAIALFGGVILNWPGVILAPAFLPAQLEMVIVTGTLLLLSLALLARGLMHPQFRRYYMGITPDES